MKISLTIAGVVAMAILAAAAMASAQEAGGSPKPAARESLPLANLQDEQDLPQVEPVTPDDRALTGAQVATLGSPELRHSYWVPGLEYGNFILSSTVANPAVSDWNSTSYIAANLSLVQSWRHAQLNLNYSGGGFFSTDTGVGNGQYQQVGFVQEFDWEKWQLAFIDQFSYLPQTQFGFGAGTNLSLPGIGGTLGAHLPGLQGAYVPSQSVYSALGPRCSNAFVTQVVRRIRPRSSLILAGSYGLLHFTEPGNVDTNGAIFTAGYEYEISKYSTFGVLYRFSAYHYANQPQATGDHTVQLAYGRKITGRVALQIFVGPEITQLRIPIGTSNQRISGAGGANLMYAFTQRAKLAGGYTHSVNNGSGVFTGAVSDQVQSSLDQTISREWHVGVHLGYSRNGTILQSTSRISPHFNTWFAGANLVRGLGPYAHFSLAYTAYLESSNLPIPSVETPVSSYVQHQITAEFGWHARPLVIR